MFRRGADGFPQRVALVAYVFLRHFSELVEAQANIGKNLKLLPWDRASRLLACLCRTGDLYGFGEMMKERDSDGSQTQALLGVFLAAYWIIFVSTHSSDISSCIARKWIDAVRVYSIAIDPDTFSSTTSGLRKHRPSELRQDRPLDSPVDHHGMGHRDFDRDRRRRPLHILFASSWLEA